MHAEDVRARRHVGWRRQQIDGNLPLRVFEAELARFVVRQRPRDALEPAAPQRDVQAETRGPANHLLPDAAETEQTERPAVETLRLRIGLLVPAARSQLADVVRDTPIERQDQRKGELRD